MSASNLTVLKYINPEDMEKDFPQLEAELRERHQMLDLRLTKIVVEKGYPTVGFWETYAVYSIPLSDLLGVRSSSFCRRKVAYRPFITEMVEGTFLQKSPLLCFVAGDSMLRVKWGNIIYWAAKETKTLSHLNCVFAGAPEKTEELKAKLLEEYKIPAISFL
jgi:hypothetical protein